MKWYDLIGLILCAYIISVSLSRAVMVSYLLLLIVFFAGQYLNIITKIAVVCLLLLYSTAQMTIFDNATFLVKNTAFFEKIVGRLQTIETENGVIEERGYERIFKHPEYLFFGAGEGAYYRFSTRGIRGLELHSGLGTILFSYGIFGFVLFFAFILSVFRYAPWPFWIILLSIMAYGITHQHIRFTGFWLFLGLSYGTIRYIIPLQVKASSHPVQ